MPAKNTASRPDALPAELLAQQVHVRQGQQAAEDGVDLQAQERQPRAEQPGDHHGQVHLDGFAAGVAREEDVRLALGHVVDVQQLLGVVAERLRRDAANTL